MKHSHIAVNGMTLHAAELGAGPVVLFCHGFPDTWRGWRRQMEAVAAKGYRALALDMRGYGQSSAPVEAALYTPFHTVGDLVGLLDALHIETAAVVGHDFGATVAWNAAMMRPDRFAAAFGISVPFLSPGGKSFLQQFREAGMLDFYMFRQMRPEADDEWADAATTIPGMLYWTSGSAPAEHRWDPFDPSRSLTRPLPWAFPIGPTQMTSRRRSPTSGGRGSTVRSTITGPSSSSTIWRARSLELPSSNRRSSSWARLTESPKCER